MSVSKKTICYKTCCCCRSFLNAYTYRRKNTIASGLCSSTNPLTGAPWPPLYALRVYNSHLPEPSNLLKHLLTSLHVTQSNYNQKPSNMLHARRANQNKQDNPKCSAPLRSSFESWVTSQPLPYPSPSASRSRNTIS